MGFKAEGYRWKQVGNMVVRPCESCTESWKFLGGAYLHTHKKNSLTASQSSGAVISHGSPGESESTQKEPTARRSDKRFTSLYPARLHRAFSVGVSLLRGHFCAPFTHLLLCTGLSCPSSWLSSPFTFSWYLCVLDRS